MKMKLPKSTKTLIKKERERIFKEMSEPDIQQREWDELNKKYMAYGEMLKSSWKFTPDTMLVVAGNLAGIFMILNFEKMDIVRSKAMSFVLKGRV